MSEPNRKRKKEDNKMEFASRMNGKKSKAPDKNMSDSELKEEYEDPTINTIFPPANVQKLPIVTDAAITQLHNVFKSIAAYGQSCSEENQPNQEEPNEDQMEKVTETLEQGLIQINRMIQDFKLQEHQSLPNFSNINEK